MTKNDVIDIVSILIDNEINNIRSFDKISSMAESIGNQMIIEQLVDIKEQINYHIIHEIIPQIKDDKTTL